VLTSFLLSLLQNVLIIIMATLIAPLAKTIATANEVIVGTGKETGIGREIGTVAGERERTASATLTATGNAQTGVTAKGTVIGNANVAAIAKRDARALKKNADETSRAKTTDVAHTAAAATMREAPLAVLAVAEAVNVMVVLQNAAHRRP
jgi:type IV secretory pathway TrbL component